MQRPPFFSGDGRPPASRLNPAPAFHQGYQQPPFRPPYGGFQQPQPFVPAGGQQYPGSANSRFPGPQRFEQPQYNAPESSGSNAVNDAFLAFHRRQNQQEQQAVQPEQSRPEPLTPASPQQPERFPDFRPANAANARQPFGTMPHTGPMQAAIPPRSQATGSVVPDTTSMQQRHEPAPRGRGAPFHGPGRGQAFDRGRGRGGPTRGSFRAGTPASNRTAESVMTPNPETKPVPTNSETPNAPKADLQSAARASERGKAEVTLLNTQASRDRGRGGGRLFDARGRGNAQARTGRGASIESRRGRGAGQLTNVNPRTPRDRERYDADFDRGTESRKPIGELFDAPIGYRANARATTTKTSAPAPAVAPASIDANQEDAVLEVDTQSEDGSSSDASSEEDNKEDEKKESAAPRAGLIQRSLQDLIPERPKISHGKGKGKSKQEKSKKRKDVHAERKAHDISASMGRSASRQDDRSSSAIVQARDSPLLAHAGLPLAQSELRQLTHASPRPVSREARPVEAVLSSPVPPARQLSNVFPHQPQQGTPERTQLDLPSIHTRPASPRDAMRAYMRAYAPQTSPEPHAEIDEQMEAATAEAGEPNKVQRPPPGHPLLDKIDTDPLLISIRIAEANELSMASKNMRLLQALEESRIDLLCEQARLSKVIKALSVPFDFRSAGIAPDVGPLIAAAKESRVYAELFHNFLLASCDGGLTPSSRADLDLLGLSSDLWHMAFEPLLGRLHTLASFATDDHGVRESVAPSLLEVYVDFVIFAYRFYADLLVETALPHTWLPAWHEALGRLALRRTEVLQVQQECIGKPVAVLGDGRASKHIVKDKHKNASRSATDKSKQKAGILRSPAVLNAKNNGRSELLGDVDSPAGNSIGTAALDDWVLREEETWRKIAREWFFRAVHVQPSNGPVHALLVDTCPPEASLQRFYHAFRSVTTSRSTAVLESVSGAPGSLSPPSPTEAMWTMIAVVQTMALLAALPVSDSIGFLPSDATALSSDDGGSLISREMAALSLSFATALDAVRKQPEGSRDPGWPYVTVLLTFVTRLATVPGGSFPIESGLPWDALLRLFSDIPAPVSATLQSLRAKKQAPGRPLPEDWCIRGSAWLGSGKGALFSTSFFSQPLASHADGRSLPASEGEMLDEHFEGSSMPAHAGGPSTAAGDHQTEAQAQSEPDSDVPAELNILQRARWERIAWCAARLAKKVRGVHFDPQTRAVSMSNAMRVRVGLPTSALETDEAHSEQSASESNSAAESDNDQASAEALSSALQKCGIGTGTAATVTMKEDFPSLQQARPMPANKASTGAHTRWENDTAVHAVPGYTSIVLEAQILLTGFALVSSMVGSKRWIVVIPLAVITELDRISRLSPSADAQSAISPAMAQSVLPQLEQLVKTHHSVLKVQTSRGNYLRDLSMRSEDLEYSGGSGSASTSATAQHAYSRIPRGVDDVVVAAAKWQVENWLDRRQLLPPGTLSPEERARKLEGKLKEAKVLLVSDSKNLRAQGRAKGLSVASFAELEKVVLADRQTDYQPS